MTDRMTIEPERPVVSDLAIFVEQARGMVITSADDYARVAEFLLGIKQLREKVAATFDVHIKRAYEAHRALVAEKREAEAEAIKAEEIAKALLAAWDTARETADADERRRNEAIAEEHGRMLDDAIATAEARGDFATADGIREERARAVPAPVVPSTPKVEGITFRETWTAKVVDLAALVAAAAAHRPWVALLKADQTALNAQARSLKSRLAIPGVEAVCSKGVGARRTFGPPSRDAVND